MYCVYKFCVQQLSNRQKRKDPKLVLSLLMVHGENKKNTKHDCKQIKLGTLPCALMIFVINCNKIVTLMEKVFISVEPA